MVGGGVLFVIYFSCPISKTRTKLKASHIHRLKFLFGVPTLHFYAKGLMKKQVWETLK